MVSLRELFINTRAILDKSGIESSRFEAKCILEQVFNLSYDKLILNPERIVGENEVRRIQDMLDKRINGMPLQYILGRWEFYGLPFIVGEGVLIPRQDTETIVELALNYAKKLRKPRIMDLCSGSGCIAVSLDKNLNNSEICAIEYSEQALTYLVKNIELNSSSVQVYKGDVLNRDFAGCFGGFDIIVSNPPYLNAEDMRNLQTEVSFEPAMALDGGSMGLRFYEGIAEIWGGAVVSGGKIILEIGIGQEHDVSEILRKNKFKDITTSRDLCGIVRAVCGTKI